MIPDLVALIASMLFLVFGIWGIILLLGNSNDYASVRKAVMLYNAAWIMAMVAFIAHLIDNASAAWIFMDFIKLIFVVGGIGFIQSHLSGMTKPAPRLSARQRAKLERQRADEEADRVKDEIMKELYEDYPFDRHKFPL